MSLRTYMLGVLFLACSPVQAEPAGGTMDPATTGSGGSGTNGAALYPCDVGAILQTKCWECHGDQTTYGAPMSLTHYESVQALTVDGTETVYQRMSERIADNTMPPPNWEPRLTSDEIATLQNWIQQGAPAGSGCQPPPGTGGGTVGQGGASAVGGANSTGGTTYATGGTTYATGGSGQGGTGSGGTGIVGAAGSPDYASRRRERRPVRRALG
jgi:hypothetical protein